MWPTLLDMTKEESLQSLRNLELEAYSSLISALRAQGPLNHEKRRLLQETSSILSINSDRHKTEVRRAINDEKLNTIAYHITGQFATFEDWAQEGRRLIPLLPRVPPQTSFSPIADETSEAASQQNKQLPLPCSTERKRVPAPPAPQVPVEATTALKSQLFRVPEVPKEETKKRKASISEGSSLAQHLLAPKTARIQQIYRQISKPPKVNSKEEHSSHSEIDLTESSPPNPVPTNLQQKPQNVQAISTPSKAPKVNILQNITLSSSIYPPPSVSETILIPDDVNDIPPNPPQPPVAVNENQAPKPKLITLKSFSMLPRQLPSSINQQGSIIEVPKILPTKKAITKGQKLIVVSKEQQNISTNSILHKTLTVTPSKMTKLNLEKFKIVSNNQSPAESTAKHKLVTIKSSQGKKVIPLSQLEMLNSKGGIKVLPVSGKILAKNFTLSSNPASTLYLTKNINSPSIKPSSSQQTVKVEVINPLENGDKVTVQRDFSILESGSGKLKTQNEADNKIIKNRIKTETMKRELQKELSFENTEEEIIEFRDEDSVTEL